MYQDKKILSSPGKIMLTAEYAVIDGAKTLSIPIKGHQKLSLEKCENAVQWISLDQDSKKWFTANWDINGNLITTSDQKIAEIIEKIFHFIGWELIKHTKFISQINFPTNFGLGTSSSLIACFAKAFHIDPLKLQWSIFGGSGYDVVTAMENHATIFQLKSPKQASWEKVIFKPPFRNLLYFTYLNKKRDSRNALADYLNQRSVNQVIIQNISDITEQFIAVSSLEKFQDLLKKHEKLIADMTGQRTIQSEFFPDFGGVVKSLGAWGGDLALIASDWEFSRIKNYFSEKGYPIIIKYNELIE